MISSNAQQLLNELKQSSVPDSYPLQVMSFTGLAEEYLAQGEYLYATGLYNYLLNLIERHPEALKDITLTDKKKSSTDQQIKDLFQAIQENDEEKVEALLEAVDINAQSSITNYVTALHHAVVHGNETVINMLLASGADPTLQVNGETASQWAAQNDRPEIAKLLDKALADKKDFKAAKLKAEYHAKLQVIEETFIQSLGASANPYAYLAVNSKHRNTLQSLRAWCHSELTKIDSQYSFDIYDEEKMQGQEEQAQQLQLKKAEAIRNLYHTIAEKMKAFIRQLVEECIAVLGQLPCEYAIIGLGSLAREEMTPYSDLEFAILIAEEKEEYKEYFRNLTKLLHLKVINLGETILPALGIPALNNYNSQDPLDNWFYDDITPRGFAFDGAMPQACKTPLGKKGNYELIHTPAEMVRLLDKFGGNPQLCIMLTSTAIIAGDITLFFNYVGSFKHELDIIRQKFSIEQLQRFLREFSPKLVGQEVEGKLYAVKNEIYRLTDRFIEGLAIYYGSNEHCDSFSRLESLCSSKPSIINKSAKDHLITTVSIALDIRLRTYLKHNAQREAMELFQIANNIEIQEDRVSQLLCLPSDNLSSLIRFYRTAVPFYKAIEQFCFEENKENILHKNIFFSNDGWTNSQIQMRLGNYQRVIDYLQPVVKELLPKYEDPHVVGWEVFDFNSMLTQLANAYWKLGLFDKQKSYVEKSIKLLGQLTMFITVKEKSNQNRQVIVDETLRTINNNIAVSYHNLGTIYLAQANYQEAKKYFQIALDKYRKLYKEDHISVAEVLHVLAGLYLQRDAYIPSTQFRQYAKQYLQEAMDICLRLNQTSHVQIVLAMCCENLGALNLFEKKYEEARRRLDEAHSLLVEHYGEIHPTVIKVLNNLSALHNELRNFMHVEALLRRCLDIFKALYNTEKHPEYADLLHNLANCLISLGKFEEAEDYLKKAEAIACEMQGKEHPNTISIVTDLIRAIVRQGNKIMLNNPQSQNALYFANNIYMRAIKRHDKFFNEDQLKGILRTSLFQSCAESAYANGKLDEAIEHYQVALILSPYNAEVLDRLKQLYQALSCRELRQYAAANNVTGVINRLKKGVNPNAKNKTGCTALHEAAKRNAYGVIKALLDAGADATLKNNDGKTASEVANENHCNEFVHELECCLAKKENVSFETDVALLTPWPKATLVEAVKLSESQHALFNSLGNSNSLQPIPLKQVSQQEPDDLPPLEELPDDASFANTEKL